MARAGIYRGLSERGVPMRLLDLLETDFGAWFTRRQLFDRYELTFGERPESALVRAFTRLVSDKDRYGIETRQVPEATGTELQVRLPWRTYIDEAAA